MRLTLSTIVGAPLNFEMIRCSTYPSSVVATSPTRSPFAGAGEKPEARVAVGMSSGIASISLARTTSE